MANYSHSGEIALLTTALIWGSGFIAVDYSLSCGFPPGLINMLRFLIGTVFLLPFVAKSLKKTSRAELITGIVAGFFFFCGFLFQAQGMTTIEVSSNALLTATNLLMVPFIAGVFFKEKIGIKVYIAVFICFLGMSILNWRDGGIHFRIGDILTLICALSFACHIAYLGHNAKDKDPMRLTFLQMFTVAAFASLYFVIVESDRIQITHFTNGMAAIVYLAAFPSALCLFLQTFGQRRTATSKSAILLSFESLFGAVFSVILGLEPLTVNLLIGGTIVLFSVIWLEWSSGKTDSPAKN